MPADPVAQPDSQHGAADASQRQEGRRVRAPPGFSGDFSLYSCFIPATTKAIAVDFMMSIMMAAMPYSMPSSIGMPASR